MTDEQRKTADDALSALVQQVEDIRFLVQQAALIDDDLVDELDHLHMVAHEALLAKVQRRSV